MSSRTANVLAVVLLLVGMGFRLWHLATNPPGFHPDEISDIRIAETVRQGRVEVFYDLGNEGREGLYETVLTVVTGAVGGGLIGYRMMSVWLGLLTLAAVYTLVKHLYTPMAALAALALLSVSMLPVLLSRTVGRESILPLLLTLILLSLAHAFSISHGSIHRTPKTTPFTALGLLLGVGFYLHEQHFIIALVSLAFIAFMIIRRPMSRRRLGYLAFTMVIMIVVAVPYMISAIRLPELSGAERVFAGLATQHPGPIDAIGRGLAGFFLIGDSNPIYNLPGRPLIDIVSALFLLIGLIVAVRFARRVCYTLPLVALFVLLPVALLPSNSPSFKSMTVLLPLVALFFGVGVSAIYQGVNRRARPVFAGLLLVLFVVNGAWTALDLFERWPALPAVQAAYGGNVAQIAHYLDKTSDELPTVLCVKNLDPEATAGLDSYELLALMMHRQNVPLRYADCGSGMIFANGGEREQIVFLEPDTMFDLHSDVRDWLAQGELLAGPDVPSQTVVVLDSEQALADTIGRFTTTVPVLFAPETPGGMALTQPPVRFGGNVAFLGYEPVSGQSYEPGDYVTLVSYWRVDGVVPSDLRLFTHVLLDPTVIAAQRDLISVLPGSLRPRDVILQISFVRLPDVMPEGRFRLSIGAYEDNTDTRLPVFEGDDQRGARLFLDEITVSHQQSES